MDITITEKESGYISKKGERIDVDMSIYLKPGSSFAVNKFQLNQLFSMVLMLRPEVNWAGKRELQDHDKDLIRVETNRGPKTVNFRTPVEKKSWIWMTPSDFV